MIAVPADLCRGGGGRIGAEDFVDGSEQLLAGEGFGEAHLGSDLFGQAEHFAVLLAGHGDELRLWESAANVHDGLDAVLFGQDHVHDDNIDSLAAKNVGSFFAGFRGDNIEANSGQGALEDIADTLLVVDDQNFRALRA